MTTFNFIVASSLAYVCLLAGLEALYPFRKRSESAIRHISRNLFVKVINQGITSLELAGSLGVAYWVQRHSNLGMRYWVEWPEWLEFILTILLMDLVVYGLHIIHHKLPLLWKLHRAHHSDQLVDGSTAFRFHPAEALIATFIKTLAFGFIGIGGTHAIAYFIFIHVITPFHHSNISISEKQDQLLRWLLVTPRMHRIHHSVDRSEHDSNYSAGFSFWDRIFKTYIKPEDQFITYGIKELSDEKWQTLKGIYLTPFAELLKQDSQYGAASGTR